MLLPDSDVLAEVPPPERKLLVIRQSRIHFGRHFPNGHIGGYSAEDENDHQKWVWLEMVWLHRNILIPR